MEKLAAFVAEIRAAPKFIIAAGANPGLIGHLSAIDRLFHKIYRDGTTDPEAIELYDQVRAAVASKAPLKGRLMRLEGILRAWQARCDRGQQ